MRHLEGGADLGQPLLALLGRLPGSFRGRGDAQRPQQVSRGRSRVTRLAEDRVQSLLGQVMKHQVDDAPGVKGLRRGGGLWLSVHENDTTSAGSTWASQLETVPGNVRFTLKRAGKRIRFPRRLSLQPEKCGWGRQYGTCFNADAHRERS